MGQVGQGFLQKCLIVGGFWDKRDKWDKANFKSV